jgi:hypothetical protein
MVDPNSMGVTGKRKKGKRKKKAPNLHTTRGRVKSLLCVARLSFSPRLLFDLFGSVLFGILEEHWFLCKYSPIAVVAITII